MKKFSVLLSLVIFTSLKRPVLAGVSFFVDNTTGFNSAASTLEFKGLENWEESTLAPGLISFLDDPLAPTIAKGTFPNGTNATSGITAQSNTLGNNPTSTSPRGTNGLAVTSSGFVGTPSDQVSTNTFGDSFDIIVNPSGNYTGAVSFNGMYYHATSSSATSNPGNLTVRVYDASNTLLGSQNLTGVDYSGSSFLGIVATAGSNIRRINIAATSDTLNSASGADNINVFGSALPIPEPAVTSFAILGAMGLMRRRRA